MVDVSPFTPIAPTVNITATNVTGNVQLTDASGGVAGYAGKVARVVNAGTLPVFIKFGGSTVTAAAATDMPIMPGATELFQLGAETYMAAITATGSATVYVTSGQGQ